MFNKIESISHLNWNPPKRLWPYSRWEEKKAAVCQWSPFWLRCNMWLCKQGDWAQCGLHHRHAGNTLSMVVLLEDNTHRQTSVPLAHTRVLVHTHTHMRIQRMQFPFIQSTGTVPLSKQPLSQPFVNRVGGYLDTADLHSWTRNTNVNIDISEHFVQLQGETLTGHFCDAMPTT